MVKKITILSIMFLAFGIVLQLNGQNAPKSKYNAHNIRKSDNLLLLISDGGDYAQVLQFSDTILKHGYARVFPSEKLLDQDIEWYTDFKIKDIYYPIKYKRLDDAEIFKVKKIIKELSKTYYKDPNDIKDDYRYIIYINNHKVVSAFTLSLEYGTLPKKISRDISEMLSIASPIYPNFGLGN